MFPLPPAQFGKQEAGNGVCEGVCVAGIFDLVGVNEIVGVLVGVTEGEKEADFVCVGLDDALGIDPIDCDGVDVGVLVAEKEMEEVAEDNLLRVGEALIAQLVLTRGDLEAATDNVGSAVYVNEGVYEGVKLILLLPFLPISIFGNAPPFEASDEFDVT
jgi:hypothetical protein